MGFSLMKFKLFERFLWCLMWNKTILRMLQSGVWPDSSSEPMRIHVPIRMQRYLNVIYTYIGQSQLQGQLLSNKINQI